MKLKFKVQHYQTNAVESVVDCFAGQPMRSGTVYQIDPGVEDQTNAFGEGFKNADLRLGNDNLLDNIQDVQRRQNLPVSTSLENFTESNNLGKHVPVNHTYKKNALDATKIHIDIEMETGTGKTYCYTKTIFEMNKRYGWSKFIIMVPSIAIREGVYKSFQITAEHFMKTYGKKVRFFIYNSKRLHELEDFSSDANIHVMIINIQAFNSNSKDNLRIYEELDDFQSRKPIDVIAENRPILILDEPQKMGDATVKSLQKFKPLFILRYSATHRVKHNKVHRLDALDAYNQKLVKKIAVYGIQTRGYGGMNAYLYLEGIDISTNAPVARIEMEIKSKSGNIKRQIRRLKFGDDLYLKSGELDQYLNGFTIRQINYNTDEVEFINGAILKVGVAIGNVSEEDKRRIQIRETIKTHLEKEKQLYAKGIKVLSLFFIDQVVKYRDYNRDDKKGDYARIFEEEYDHLKSECLSELTKNEEYKKYLCGIETVKTHKGYFSIDKKTKRFKDSKFSKQTKETNDVDAYNIILKDKERLLSFEESTRFIFSHSALREGWDNPNVFVMCMLKQSDNTISRRQEVGRGLRLSVDQHGDRMDHPDLVHDINVLTVVASESYQDFVEGLQQEITQTLSSRPQQATETYFTGKLLSTETGKVKVTKDMAAGLEYYLVQNGYVDRHKNICKQYHNAKKDDTLAELPYDLRPYTNQVFQLINSVFSEEQLPIVSDGRKRKTNQLNDNFEKDEFQKLWTEINKKAVYRVEFDSSELINKCINALNDQLYVTRPQYMVQLGVQNEILTNEQQHNGDGFELMEENIKYGNAIYSTVKYDLIGKLAENTQLTRKTIANILKDIDLEKFDQFKQNPEHFIVETSRIIKEQKATTIIEGLTYNKVEEKYDTDIFTVSQYEQDFSRATDKLKKHVYDYAITDSDVERKFVRELDDSKEIVVYAKLPRGFLIPTPVGDYNPDWAISFENNSIKHIYFVAETKGAMSSMQLRKVEETKINCARNFFKNITEGRVRYDMVTDYAKLINIVSGQRQNQTTQT